MVIRFWFYTIICGTLLVGCCQPGAHFETPRSADNVDPIRVVISGIFEACMQKDFDRLESYHDYGPSFTKFTSGVDSLLTAEAARAGERDGMAPLADLTMSAQDLRIDRFDNVAVATCVLRYGFRSSQGPVDKRAKMTLVFRQKQGAWKIVHEHLSALSQ